MKPTQEDLEDSLVFVLGQTSDGLTRSQASKLMDFLNKKACAQPYWQHRYDDGTPRWQKHIDYARMKAVEDGLIVRPSKGDRGLWRLTDKGKRRAERAARAVADRL